MGERIRRYGGGKYWNTHVDQGLEVTANLRSGIEDKLQSPLPRDLRAYLNEVYVKLGDVRDEFHGLRLIGERSASLRNSETIDEVTMLEQAERFLAGALAIQDQILSLPEEATRFTDVRPLILIARNLCADASDAVTKASERLQSGT